MDRSPKEQARPRPMGRPFLGLTNNVQTRVRDDTKRWLTGMVTETGRRESDLVRLLLEDAQRRNWRPR